MPYDDITKMRAELLERYGPNERPEEFDDGASSLGQNPYMQEVGVFGKPPKFNPSRRTMGLDLPSVKNPVPTAIEDPTTAVVPVQPQQPKTSPLEALANMPMTRRKALEIPMNAAISNVGRGLIGEAVSPAIKSAMTTPAISENQIYDYASSYVSSLLDKAIELNEDSGYSGIVEHMGLDQIEEVSDLLKGVSLKSLSDQTKIPIPELKKYFSDDDLKEALKNTADIHDRYMENYDSGEGLDVGTDVEGLYNKVLKEKYGGVYPIDSIEEYGFGQDLYAEYIKDLKDSATGYSGSTPTVNKLTDSSLKRNQSILGTIDDIIDSYSDDLQYQVNEEINKRLTKPSRKRRKSK